MTCKHIVTCDLCGAECLYDGSNRGNHEHRMLMAMGWCFAWRVAKKFGDYTLNEVIDLCPRCAPEKARNYEVVP